MAFKERYLRLKPKFISNKKICPENRKLFEKYFEWHERKLQSINNLRKLDEKTYKTLYSDIMMLGNINRWFKNKPLRKITKSDIKQVYEDLEDGKIKNNNGQQFEDREGYYSKIFKGKLFKTIKKYEYADEILEFWKPTKNNGKVKFFTEESFNKMILCCIQLSHKLLIQLGWDVGENIMTLLELQKKDFRKRLNPTTKEPEYLVNLSAEKIKRSRTPRTEPTNFNETVELLDMFFAQGKRVFTEDKDGKEFRRIYKGKTRKKIKGSWKVRAFQDEDKLFDFGHKQAEQIFRRIIEKSKVTCAPNKNIPTLKDLRSSMACHLLKIGWSVDEVKGRMGHKPSSSVIDKYASYLALDKSAPKQKVYESNLKGLQEELEKIKQRELLTQSRLKKTEQTLKKVMDQGMEANRAVIKKLAVG